MPFPLSSLRDTKKTTFQEKFFLFFHPTWLIHQDIPAETTANADKWNNL